MINSHFVYVAAALSVVGAWAYFRDTWRGLTAPNRVTWSLWAVEGVFGFFVEVQQGVGLAALTTLMLGLVPLAIVAASFRGHASVWRIGTFDVICGALSLVGIGVWLLSNQPTAALVAFVAADELAALPTLRKSWLEPGSETALAFLFGTANCTVTLATLHHWTTAGALFPACVAVTDLVLALLIWSKLGPRLRKVSA